MKSGIKLKFDEDLNVDIDDKANTKEECFGGVMCVHAKRSIERFHLSDGTTIKTHPITCEAKNLPVVGFEQCPQGRWVRLDGPIGWQNLTREEQQKWSVKDTDAPSSSNTKKKS